MAGHSKWANIRHRKSRQDAKRGKIFTRLIREITVAARMGGGDPGATPRLRAAINDALSNNMTKDTINRAVTKGAGGGEGDTYDEIRYEGYGPGGIAVMVDCMTDNRNRTVAEVRHAFSKSGGNLGTDGSVAYLFAKVGLLSYPAGSDEDALMEAALEAGAEDVVVNDDGKRRGYDARRDQQSARSRRRGENDPAARYARRTRRHPEGLLERRNIRRSARPDRRMNKGHPTEPLYNP